MVEKGWVYNFSEVGDETRTLLLSLLPMVRSRAKNFVVQNVGDVLRLKKLETFHFMMAGPEGAIVDEWACYHDNDGLRFTNTKACVIISNKHLIIYYMNKYYLLVSLLSVLFCYGVCRPQAEEGGNVD